MSDPEGQRDGAGAPDAEHHLLLLELLLPSVHIVTEAAEAMVEIFYMRVHDRALKNNYMTYID